ncbi:MAG: TPM domain-containing protein, partial [Firmicutes bacterium]|nr:TPM domain-containing protein [Candidatus Colimorpha enterica]
MKRRFISVIILALLCLSSCASSLVKPSDCFYVYDECSVISENTKDHIVSVNDQVNKACGGQIVVAVIRSIGLKSISSYASDLFNSWKIGDRDKQNGVLLLIVQDKDDYWCVQGKGLENKLSAGMIKTYLDTCLEPHYAKGDVDGGVRELFDKLVAEYESIYSFSIEGTDTPGSDPEPEEGGLLSSILKLSLVSFALTLVKKLIGFLTKILGFIMLIAIVIFVLWLISKLRRPVFRSPHSSYWYRGNTFGLGSMLGRRTNYGSRRSTFSSKNSFSSPLGRSTYKSTRGS